MRTDIEIICDRCGGTVRGVIIDDPRLPKITGGFYDVSEGSWQEFAFSEEEKNVCDLCMWADPRYILRYPGHNKIPSPAAPLTRTPRHPKEIERLKSSRTAIRKSEERAFHQDEPLEFDMPDKPKKPETPEKPDKPKK